MSSNVPHDPGIPDACRGEILLLHTADGIEARTQALVSRYLELVEKYGSAHPQVLEFLEKHGKDPEILAWTQVVDELERKGRASRRLVVPTRLIRLARGVTVVLLVLTSLFGVNAYTARDQTEVALAAAKADAEQTRATLAVAKTDGEQSRTALATAKTDLEDVLAKLAEAQTHSMNLAGRLQQADRVAADRLQRIQALSEQVVLERAKRLDTETVLARAKEEHQKSETRWSETLQTVKLERESLSKKLELAQFELRMSKGDGDGKNAERAAIIVLASSRISGGDEYVAWPRRDVTRFLPSDIKGAAGIEYARGTLYRVAGDERAYEKCMMMAAKDPRWSTMASTDMHANKNPVEFIRVLSGLTKQIQDGYQANDPDPVTISYLIVQREIATLSFVKSYGLLIDKKSKSLTVQLLREKVAGKSVPTAERVAAIDMLGAIWFDLTEDRGQVIKDLALGLQDDQPIVRWHTARALGAFGPVAERVTGDLIRLRDDKDEWVRAQAIRALRRIDPNSAPDR